METPDSITSNQIHLWYSRVPIEIEPGLSAQYMSLLTPAEAAQLKRFYFDKDKRRYLTTRALVRSVLSRYAPIEAHAWRFEPTSHGRPVITNPHPLAQRLSFNISHTDSAVVLAVTTGRDIGVDIESTERNAPLEVADRYFSAHEAAALRSLPPAEQPHRFWELWTFKESYIKARGLGLSLPLHKFSFHFEHPGGVHISFEEELNESPARWELMQLRLDADHLLALCVQRAHATPTLLVCTQVTPLAGMQSLPALVSRRGILPPGFEPAVLPPLPAA
jgi:4'-phosphopantetheinyl transferase